MLADCSNNYSRILDLNNLSQTFVRTWSKTTRNRMTCSDCHASETAGDPLGPHGSAVGFLLRGPNTDWNSSMSVANSTSFNNNTATYKAFCFNCHDPGFASDNSWFHKADANYGAHHHNTVPCLGCHAAVQHGGPRPGMLVGTSGVNTYYGNPGSYADWDTAAPYAVATGLYIWRQPAPGEMWQMSDCGCYGPDHGH